MRGFHKKLESWRSYIFVGNLVIAAFITPNALTTIFLVLPIQLLLELSILAGKYLDA
jgi:Sec-independent protein secretion pathway component TatC